MATKTTKRQHVLEDQDSGTNSHGIDRFSDLPDSIIFHIMSFLPTIFVVRMCLLSKRWRYLWTLMTTLSFFDHRSCMNDNVGIGRLGSIDFDDSVYFCLQSHRRMNVPIKSFEFHIWYQGNDGFMNWFLKHLFKLSNVEVLNLSHYNHPKPWCGYYKLHKCVLHAKSLTRLQLFGIEIVALAPVSLPSLKYLSLMFVKMDDFTLHNIILGCPPMKNLLIKKVPEFSKPPTLISNRSCNFEIDDTFLEIVDDENWNLKFILDRTIGTDYFLLGYSSAIRNVQDLSLSMLSIQDQLEGLASKLPLLENLTLDRCSGFKCFNFRSTCLKRFVLICNERSDVNVAELTMETPNLAFFLYEGPMISNVSVKCPNLLEASVKFPNCIEYDTEWYSKLMDFLRNFDFSKCLKVEVSSEMALIFPTELRIELSSPLPNLKNMKVKILSPLGRDRDLRDVLLWFAPSLDSLSIVASN